MKGTNQFKTTIKSHLDKLASIDQLFAARYAAENKTIEDCITYILNEVQKSGCNGFADEEIYGMAVHYYVEDNVEVGERRSGGSVVVNHVVELTEEEKAEAKQKAIDEAIAEAKAKMQGKQTAAVKPSPNQQISLF